MLFTSLTGQQQSWGCLAINCCPHASQSQNCQRSSKRRRRRRPHRWWRKIWPQGPIAELWDPSQNFRSAPRHFTTCGESMSLDLQDTRLQKILLLGREGPTSASTIGGMFFGKRWMSSFWRVTVRMRPVILFTGLTVSPLQWQVFYRGWFETRRLGGMLLLYLGHFKCVCNLVFEKSRKIMCIANFSLSEIFGLASFCTQYQDLSEHHHLLFYYCKITLTS